LRGGFFFFGGGVLLGGEFVGGFVWGLGRVPPFPQSTPSVDLGCVGGVSFWSFVLVFLRLCVGVGPVLLVFFFCFIWAGLVCGWVSFLVGGGVCWGVLLVWGFFLGLWGVSCFFLS